LWIFNLFRNNNDSERHANAGDEATKHLADTAELNINEHSTYRITQRNLERLATSQIKPRI
jgi:hypothetical protein